MFKKVSSFAEYVAWLYKYNLELQKISNNIFRLLQMEENKNGECIAKIQVINKSNTFNCNINDIASNETFLECFSKNDIYKITKLCTAHDLKPKHKIVSFEYDEAGKTIVNIKSQGSNKIISLSVDEISNDKQMLRELNQEDAKRIGILTVFDQMIVEKKEFEKFDRNKVNGK